MFFGRRRGGEFAQELPASAGLAMQVATPYITQRLVVGAGDHHIATVKFVHQFQCFAHRGFRAD